MKFENKNVHILNERMICYMASIMIVGGLYLADYVGTW